MSTRKFEEFETVNFRYRFPDLKKHRDFLTESYPEVDLEYAISGYGGQNNGRALYIAHDCETDEILGLIIIHRNRDMQIAELGLLVCAMHRNKGVGRRLILDGIDMLQQLGVIRIDATVAVDNYPSLAMFEHTGMINEATLRNYARSEVHNNLVDGVIFSKVFDK